ncbi:unnamed protein product, partial [Rotaria magnacalcarata]
MNIYQRGLERAQDQWMNDVLKHFSTISETIKNYLVNLANRLSLNISTSADLNTFLCIPVAIAKECLLGTTSSIVD